MTILFSQPTPDKYPENYFVINDVLRTSRLFKTNRGCEVGVRHGIFSYYLLEKNQWLSMWCVDPYLPYQDVIDFQDEKSQNETRVGAAKLLTPFGDRVHWMYEDSLDAARKISRGFFDFVFVDANHEYKFVKQDISHWHTCVRPGGLFCGHDYSMEGVKQAVDEFAKYYDYEVKHVGMPSDVWLIEIRHAYAKDAGEITL